MPILAFPLLFLYIFSPLLGLQKAEGTRAFPSSVRIMAPQRLTSTAEHAGTRVVDVASSWTHERSRPTTRFNPLRFPSVANAADSHLPTDHRSFYLDPRRKNERQGLAAPPGRRLAYLSHLDTCEKRSEKGNTHATPVMKCSLSYCHPPFPLRAHEREPPPLPTKLFITTIKKKKELAFCHHNRTENNRTTGYEENTAQKGKRGGSEIAATMMLSPTITTTTTTTNHTTIELPSRIRPPPPPSLAPCLACRGAEWL